MQAAEGLEAFLADPVGHYVAGRRWLYWRADESLVGFVLWGRPDEDDIRRLTEVLGAEQRPDARPHVSLVDARRLEGVDANSFQVLTDFLAPRWQQLARVLLKQAVVRPQTPLVGSVVAGFYQVLVPTYPVRVFSDPADALPWLGAGTHALVREVDALQAQAAGTPAVVRALREHLASRLATAQLPVAARSLGMSERTLQRRLHEAGTTFQAEVNGLQIETAQRLMLDTDLKLTAVALEVGCASLQHFSALFRKHVGASPSAWRAGRRPGLEREDDA